jgi:hypothetical protein
MRVVQESLLIVPARIISYSVLPNHWHFVLWPEQDGELSDFMHHPPKRCHAPFLTQDRKA